MYEQEFDIVVVGAGVSGGFPAAAYLQHAGLSVALVESRPGGGVFYHSYTRGGDVLFDVAPVNFSCMSPALIDLGLLERGYKIDYPAIGFATLDGTNRSIIYWADRRRTVNAIACHSERDANTFDRLISRLSERSRDILSAGFFTPRPDIERAYALTAEAVEIDVAELLELSAVGLLERLFESEATRLSLMALPALHLFGDLLTPGEGSMSLLWTFILRACRAPGGSSSLAAALQDVFVADGGNFMPETSVTRFTRASDGRCNGVVVGTRGGERYLAARYGVISNLGARRTSELLGTELCSTWRTDGRTVLTADLILDRPLEWADEDMKGSPRVYLLWSAWDECIEYLADVAGGKEGAFLGHIELTQFNALYGSSASGGFGLRVRFGTGPFIDCRWNGRREKYVAAARDIVARLDPKACIRSADVMTPRDYWNMNPAAVHGNPVGGDVGGNQWIGKRLPYRSGIENLYLANSVWPTSLSWMAPGYNAACQVLEDLSMERPSWWSTAPVPDLTA